MSLRACKPATAFTLPILLAVAGALSAANNIDGGNTNLADTFAMDGKSIITAPEHLGIINGKLTIGTPHGQVARIDGLWAPPYVSSDFFLSVEVFDQEVVARGYQWWPFKVERQGQVEGIEVSTATLLASGKRGGLITLSVHNTNQQTLEVPLTFKCHGTLDRCDFWEFAGAKSSTATKPAVDQAALTLTAGQMSIALQGSCATLRWNAKNKTGKQIVNLKPNETRAVALAFAMGELSEAKNECAALAADPAETYAEADLVHGKQVATIFQLLPRLTSSSRELQEYYHRSLAHFITNRWDVPEFVLQPYYSTGSIRGGCVCNYLWNYGMVWEIMPLYDPAAHREHIKQFLKCDMTRHFSFNPIDGKAWGPWYMVNQEKIIGMVYYYIKNTGHVEFLDETVDGKTVLEHVLINAIVLDDVSKPVALIDYGPSNSHLELRRRHDGYNHIMPDLNGRRHANYLRAARLAEIAGKPAPHLRERAKALKMLLKQKLWNPETKWFDFINGKGAPETRWTVQMFKLFGSSVLDEEMEAGLASHLNEEEFLSEHGLHSLAKGDALYDPNDVDNGGPGACTSFPAQIAERLYKAGKPKQGADLLKRCLWWGTRLPYWGDSIVAERIDYRRDTPLQCTLDSVAIAQSIIFGMFGIDAQFDGSILIRPYPPSYSPRIALHGMKLRETVFAVEVDEQKFKVTAGGESIVAAVGQTVCIHTNGLLEVIEEREGAGEY